MYHYIGNSPFGWIRITSSGDAVTALRFLGNEATPVNDGDDVSRETWRQIEAWCDGERIDFNVPLNPEVSPALSRWLGVLTGVPYGATVTYGELARRGGMPGAPRAAGSACARNPVPLIIPCHRVTRYDGSLGNFGGIEGFHIKDPRNLALKQALIDHEARYVSRFRNSLL